MGRFLQWRMSEWWNRHSFILTPSTRLKKKFILEASQQMVWRARWTQMRPTGCETISAKTTFEQTLLTGLHPWNSWSVCTEVGWKAKAGLLATGYDPPRTKPKLGWSRATESGCGGAAVEAGRQGWASAAERGAWPAVRASAHSASQRPAASPPGRNDCTPPGRSHRGLGTGQRWTCLERRTQEKNCNIVKTTTETTAEDQSQVWDSTSRGTLPFVMFCTDPCL